MNSTMNFKNNISTTPEQSKRLLALGVKPETADMHYTSIPTLKADTLQVSASIFLDLGAPGDGDVPSWSLSRLLEMMPDSAGELTLKVLPPMVGYFSSDIGRFCSNADIFENCVGMIEWLIKGRYFNQDYLIHSNSSKTGKEARND